MIDILMRFMLDVKECILSKSSALYLYTWSIPRVVFACQGSVPFVW